MNTSEISRRRRGLLSLVIFLLLFLIGVGLYYALHAPEKNKKSKELGKTPHPDSHRNRPTRLPGGTSRAPSTKPEESDTADNDLQDMAVCDKQVAGTGNLELDPFLREGLPADVDNDPFTFEDGINSIRRVIMERPGYPNWVERRLQEMWSGVGEDYERERRSEIFTPEFLAEMEAHKERAREWQQKYVSALLSGDPQASKLEQQVLAMLGRGEYPLFPEIRDMLVRAWRGMSGSQDPVLVDKMATMFVYCDAPESLDFVMVELQFGNDPLKVAALARAMQTQVAQGRGLFYGSSGMSRGREKVSALVQIIGVAYSRAVDPSTRTALFGVLAGWAAQVKSNLVDIEGRLAWAKKSRSDCDTFREYYRLEDQHRQESIDWLRGLLEMIKGYQAGTGSRIDVSSLSAEERIAFIGKHLNLEDASQRAQALQLFEQENDVRTMFDILSEWQLYFINRQALDPKADLSAVARDISTVLYRIAVSANDKRSEAISSYLNMLEKCDLDSSWAAKIADRSKPLVRPLESPASDDGAGEQDDSK